MAISANNDRLTIIIPRELKAQLKELADSENRSVSNYIVTILEDYVTNKGAQRDYIQQLGRVNRPNYNDPTIQYTMKEIKDKQTHGLPLSKYDTDYLNKVYGVDFNDENKPRKKNSTFIRDGIDIELDDPKGE